MTVSRCIAQELLKFLDKYEEAYGRFVLLFSSVSEDTSKLQWELSYLWCYYAVLS